jgi:hypothetical protein
VVVLAVSAVLTRRPRGDQRRSPSKRRCHNSSAPQFLVLCSNTSRHLPTTRADRARLFLDRQRARARVPLSLPLKRPLLPPAPRQRAQRGVPTPASWAARPLSACACQRCVFLAPGAIRSTTTTTRRRREESDHKRERVAPTATPRARGPPPARPSLPFPSSAQGAARACRPSISVARHVARRAPRSSLALASGRRRSLSPETRRRRARGSGSGVGVCGTEQQPRPSPLTHATLLCSRSLNNHRCS